MSTAGNIDRPQAAARRIWAGNANTNASGQATFNFGTVFAGVTGTDMVVEATVESGIDGVYHRCEVTSKSSSGCIVEVTRANNTQAGGLLGIGAVDVTGAQSFAPAGSVIVNVIATVRD